MRACRYVPYLTGPYHGQVPTAASLRTLTPNHPPSSPGSRRCTLARLLLFAADRAQRRRSAGRATKQQRRTAAPTLNRHPEQARLVRRIRGGGQPSRQTARQVGDWPTHLVSWVVQSFRPPRNSGTPGVAGWESHGVALGIFWALRFGILGLRTGGLLCAWPALLGFWSRLAACVSVRPHTQSIRSNLRLVGFDLPRLPLRSSSSVLPSPPSSTPHPHPPPPPSAPPRLPLAITRHRTTIATPNRVALRCHGQGTPRF